MIEKQGGLMTRLGDATRDQFLDLVITMVAGTLAYLLSTYLPTIGEGVRFVALGAIVVLTFLCSRAIRRFRLLRLRKSAGVASGEKPAILLTKLVGDTSNVRRLEIDRAIRAIFGESKIEVLLWPFELTESEGTQSARMAQFEQTANEWLDETRCNVVLCGTVGANGATLLSLYSRTKGIVNLKGLAGDLLLIDETISEEIALHIAMRLAKSAIDDFGHPVASREFDAIVSVIDDMANHVTKPELRHSLLSAKGQLLLSKGQRDAGFERVKAATKAFELAQQAVSPVDQEHLWNRSQLDIASCDFVLGSRTGNIDILNDVIARLETDASKFNGNRCSSCLSAAAIKKVSVRIESLKLRWDESQWLQGREVVTAELAKLQDRGLDAYWDLRTVDLQYVGLGIVHLDHPLPMYSEATSAYFERMEIPHSIKSVTRKYFLVTAGVVNDNVFSRTYDLKVGRKAIKLYTEALSCLSRKNQSRDWAELQINKSNCFRIIGSLEEGIGALMDAVQCGEDALELLQSEEELMLRARAYVALANAYDLLGRRSSKIEFFDKSFELQKNAAVIYAKRKLRREWQQSRMNMAIVLAHQSRLLNSTAANEATSVRARKGFETAEKLASGVVAHYSREGSPAALGLAFGNLAFVQRTFGLETDNLEKLKDGIASCRRGLRIVSRDEDASSWRLLTYNLGSLLFDLGTARDEIGKLLEARDILNGLIQSAGSENSDSKIRNSQELVDAIDAHIDSRTDGD